MVQKLILKFLVKVSMPHYLKVLECWDVRIWHHSNFLTNTQPLCYIYKDININGSFL